MKKLFNSVEKIRNNKVYDKLQNNRKRIKNRAILMIIFLFGVNAFAWFAYIAQADFNFEATVVAWDVNFYNDSVEVNDMVIDVGEIYPGYGDVSIDSNNVPYNKTIEISNLGEVDAKFSYRIKDFTVMGESVIPEGYSNEEILEMFEKVYPFTITMSATRESLKPNEKLDFVFNLFWTYEEENKYFQLNELYDYDSSINYYTYANNVYSVLDVTENNFTNLRNSLYVEKDDADSFFGNKCAIYEAETGQKCINVIVELKVEQMLS